MKRQDESEVADILKSIAVELSCFNVTADLLAGEHSGFVSWSACRFPDGHHYGWGGMGEHLLEVVKTCLNMADFYIERGYQIDKKLLFIAALFHDVGKYYDYEPVGLGTDWDATDHKFKIHHISKGYLIWNQTVDAGKYGFTEEFVEHVSHCILSHHRAPEWGSPVEPQTMEAVILHHCDSISASINHIGNKCGKRS